MRLVGSARGLVVGPPVLGVSGAALDELIVRQRDRFAERGEAVEWRTYGHDVPADVPGRLVAAGFVAEPTELTMVAPSAQLAVRSVVPAPVVLRQVWSVAELRAVAELQSSVWGGDWGWLADDLAARVAARPDDVLVVVAEADGVVVSAAWLVITAGSDFAGLFGGATLPAWRSRGIYRALIGWRARVAVRRRVRYLSVDASDASGPILAGLGFVTLTTTTPYVWRP